MTLKQIAACLALSLGIAAPAFAGHINASGSGWINSAGTKNASGFTGTQNLYAGWESGNQFNNWIAFNLPNVSFLSATLYIYNPANASTLDPNAVYSLHQASSFSFAGLAAGADLGSVTLGVADTGVSHYVAITLNATALAELNANAGKAFDFGGTITTSYPNPASLSDKIWAWGATSGTPAPYIEYNVGQAVPEPASLGLLACGLGLLAGVGVLRARKSR